jgi:hypothetical protein
VPELLPVALVPGERAVVAALRGALARVPVSAAGRVQLVAAARLQLPAMAAGVRVLVLRAAAE